MTNKENTKVTNQVTKNNEKGVKDQHDIINLKILR